MAITGLSGSTVASFSASDRGTDGAGVTAGAVAADTAIAADTEGAADTADAASMLVEELMPAAWLADMQAEQRAVMPAVVWPVAMPAVAWLGAMQAAPVAVIAAAVRLAVASVAAVLAVASAAAAVVTQVAAAAMAAADAGNFNGLKRPACFSRRAFFFAPRPKVKLQREVECFRSETIRRVRGR
jgi:hypothetical protein